MRKFEYFEFVRVGQHLLNKRKHFVSCVPVSFYKKRKKIMIPKLRIMKLVLDVFLN